MSPGLLSWWVTQKGGPCMGMVRAFHTSSDEDGGKRVFHNQKECESGQEIIRNGNRIDGAGGGFHSLRAVC
jgi:hypothetical protein